jgi:hypothetical protein
MHPKALRFGDNNDCKITEYNNKYRAYDITGKPKAFKPEQQMVHDGGPLDDATTFKTDYIQHALPEKYVHKGDLYVKPPGAMDGVTTYHKDYPGKYADRTQSMKPAYNYDRGDVPFEGHPTYKDDYKMWQQERTKAIKKDNLYMPPTTAMENQTTFRTDYVPRDLPYTKSCKPDNMALVSKEPFDDLTNHKLNFINHPLPEKFQRARDPYRPTKEPLESMTTQQRDYVGYAPQKNESFKPKNDGFRSQAPLDDATEFKDSYKQWDLPKRDMRAAAAYVKPAGIMDNMTSNKKDYIAHPLHPTRSMKPVPNMTGNDAQFDDTTTFKTDFKGWQGHHEIRKDPSRKNYELPSVPFEGMATYKAHYIEHGLNPVKSCKPDNFIDANRAPFEGDTMYKSEYVNKRTEPCPVVELPRHGYRFLETNTQGHQVYTK